MGMLNKITFTLVLLIFLSILAIYFQPKFLLQFLQSSEVVYFFPTSEKLLCLSIDDGPHENTTREILDVLRELHAPATFFLIGAHVRGNEALVARMRAEGHEIANHGWSDRAAILQSQEDFDEQMAATTAVLRPFAPVRWFRRGSGFYDNRLIQSVQSKGLRIALGSIYPHDVAVPSVLINSWYICANAFPGGIIVLHDGPGRGQRTSAVLRRIIPALRAEGYAFRVLSDLHLPAEKQP